MSGNKETVKLNKKQNAPKLRRTRRERKPKKEGPSALERYWTDIAIITGSIVAILLMVAPSIVAWGSDYSLEWMGFTLWLLVLIFALFRLRHHANHRQSWWKRSGCPDCGEKALKRRRRNRVDRLIGWLGIPRRRYVCANCSWIGARIDDAYV